MSILLELQLIFWDGYPILHPVFPAITLRVMLCWLCIVNPYLDPTPLYMTVVGQGGGQPHLHGDPFDATDSGRCLVRRWAGRSVKQTGV